MQCAALPQFQCLTGGKLPFNVGAVKFVSYMTWNAPPGTNKADRRVTAMCRVDDLGIPVSTRAYLRAIAGPHYNGRRDLLRITSEAHSDSASNKRAVLERLAALVTEAGKLATQYPAFTQPQRRPSYSHGTQ